MALISPQQKFNRLTTIERDRSKKIASWFCRCVCGNITSIQAGHLTSGHTQSCGCLSLETRSTRALTHGQSDSSEYSIWAAMKKRCTNTNALDYHRYGGRGIKVCSEWLESFEAFYKDMGPKPTPEHTIERNNSNGDYEPSNCRWATRLEQANNRSSNRLIKGLDGKMATIADVTRCSKIKRQTLLDRLDKGMSLEEAVTKPIREHYEYNGFNLSLPEWSAKLGIRRMTLYDRINKLGWPIEKALTTPLVT